jgi:PAS domain S-box-containing protein
MKTEPTKEYYIPSFLDITPIAILVIALSYALIAHISLQFMISPGRVTPFYPAMGLALIAVLILGRRVLFGVWLGSFLVNIFSFYQASHPIGQSLWTDALVVSFIAISNTIGVGLGAFVIDRYCKKEYYLNSGKNVLIFFFAGVFVCSMINSLLGILNLLAWGYISWQKTQYTWLTWWLGDSIGVIVAAPFFLTWSYKNHFKKSVLGILELIALAAIAIFLCIAVFFYIGEVKYLLLALLLFSAYRFGMRTATSLILVISIFATVATSLGFGPFATTNSNHPLLFLDLFLSVSAVCTLLFAAVISERKHSDETLKKQTHSLNERVKELKCLYSISEIAQKKDISLDDIITKSLPIIAKGYQFPEITTCRISLMGSLHTMSNFRKTMWSQECDIFIDEEALGRIEVYYLEERPLEDDGPFLLEEYDLIKSISDILGKTIENMQTMEELQKKQDILQSTIESPKDISIYSINRNYEYLSFNHLHQLLIEQKSNIVIEKGMNILNCIDNQEEKTKYKTEFDRVFEGESFSIIEENKKDLTYWEIKCSPIINRKNKIVGATVFSLNITDRIKAADDLRRSEEKYRSVFENVQDVFYITKMDGTFIEISPSVKTVTGYEATELIGSKARDLYISGDRELFLDALNKQGKVKSFEMQTTHKNGKTIDVAIDATLIFDSEGNPTHIESVLRDITERKKVEEALRKSEEKYRTIFENVQDVFFQTSMIDNMVLEVSPSCKMLSGYTREEIIGTQAILFFYKPEQREMYIETLLKKGEVHDYELELKTKKGEFRNVSVSSKLIYAADGKPNHIDGIMRDITQRKINEIEIANQNTRLQVQNKELEQFVHVTSHDLQEPLITLKCFSELICEEYINTLDDQGKQYLNFIFQSSTRMQELVRGLLEYSRIGRESNLSIIDCKQTLSDILADLKVLIDKNNVQVSIDNMPTINGYPLGIRLLFQNLITNAIKFRKKDVVPQITITASEQEKDWLFSVKDNGIGIEEKNYDKIFIIFKRLHNRDDYEGTGIGLAQCKKIIALHGGAIWIESMPGEGSTFKFTIPKISIN